MTDKGYILSMIWEYAGERIKEPRRRLPKGCFKRRSYQKWAVEEMVRRIERERTLSPSIAVEQFAQKMEQFSRGKKKEDTMFAVAYDVAKDILDILTAMR